MHDEERPADSRIERWFRKMQRGLEYVVAAFLGAFAVMALVTAVLEFRGSLLETDDFTLALTRALDAVLLTIILLELLRTVLSRSPLGRRMQEFLIIGVFSAVRYSLEVIAGTRGPSSHLVANQDPRTIVTALAINAFGILLLAVALWLVRQRSHA
ncbi:MAG: hypothetical protein NVS3B7_08380 [Candidatus Elarobacter sp.]